MSMTTPAGWFPDPNTPGTERWWDGTVWTAHTRPVQAQVPVPPPVPAGPAGFGPPTVPMAHAASGGGGRGRLLALAAAGVVLVGAVAVGAVLLGKGDDADPGAAPNVSGKPRPRRTRRTASPRLRPRRTTPGH